MTKSHLVQTMAHLLNCGREACTADDLRRCGTGCGKATAECRQTHERTWYRHLHTAGRQDINRHISDVGTIQAPGGSQRVRQLCGGKRTVDASGRDPSPW